MRAGERTVPRAAALVVAAAVLAAFAVWAGVQAHSLRASQASQNVALTDRTATNQVTRQIASAVSTIFSYSYSDPAATRRAAQRLLTGTAIRQYDSLFALVEQKAPAEKLVLTTNVTNIGVEFLTGGQARLLVFVDQQDQAGSGRAVYSGSMLAVNAVSERGRWLIENIQTFTGNA